MSPLPPSVQCASNALTTVVAASAKSLSKGASGTCFSPKVGSSNDIWTVTLRSAFAGQNAVPAGERSRMDLFLTLLSRGVESKPTQHRLHRLSHRLHGKKLNALCRTLKCLSCAKHHTILIGVICDLICVICVIWIAFFPCFAAPMAHKSRIPERARPRRGADDQSPRSGSLPSFMMA
jgi:hypothetical protein